MMAIVQQDAEPPAALQARSSAIPKVSRLFASCDGLRRQIRPALKKDLKTAQELLRNANPTTTMEIYPQAVSEGKREPQNKVVAGIIPGGALQHPWRPL